MADGATFLNPPSIPLRAYGWVLIQKMTALIGIAIPKDLEGSEEYFKIVPER